MSSSEVFRPSNGDLLVRSYISQTEGRMSRQGPSGFRPGSRSGYRFGQLSHSSFFARHNPHPVRVRHIKGLLDVPICAVSDIAPTLGQLSLQFPPNAYDQQKLRTTIPTGALNVNSQLYPTNTITGMQFLQKIGPQQNGNNNNGVADAWRAELMALKDSMKLPPVRTPIRRPTSRPRTTQYSEETGRLIPPPSRAMSRGGPSRQGPRERLISRLGAIGDNPDLEMQILQMLCSMLQTDDPTAAQNWLLTAGQREKSMVMDMIMSAISSNDEYKTQNGDREMAPQVFLEEGKMIGSDDADRLTLDGGSPKPQSPLGYRPPSIVHEETDAEAITHPIMPEVFRDQVSAYGDRPTSGLTRPKSEAALKPKSPFDLTDKPTMRYVQTPLDMEPYAME